MNTAAASASQLLAQLKKLGGLTTVLDMDIRFEHDLPVVRMPIRREHTGAPGVAHGGAVMALLDAGLGARAFVIAHARGQVTSTVEMKVNFLRPGPLGATLRVETQVELEGRNLLVIRGRAIDEASGKAIGLAIGTFNLAQPGDMAERFRAALSEANEAS